MAMDNTTNRAVHQLAAIRPLSRAAIRVLGLIVMEEDLVIMVDRFMSRLVFGVQRLCRVTTEVDYSIAV